MHFRGRAFYGCRSGGSLSKRESRENRSRVIILYECNYSIPRAASETQKLAQQSLGGRNRNTCRIERANVNRDTGFCDFSPRAPANSSIRDQERSETHRERLAAQNRLNHRSVRKECSEKNTSKVLYII